MTNETYDIGSNTVCSLSLLISHFRMPTIADMENESFLDSVIVFVKGALIFIVSQAWNSAIQSMIESSVFFHRYGKIAYALFITLFAVYTLKIITNFNYIIKICRDQLTSSECNKVMSISNFFST